MKRILKQDLYKSLGCCFAWALLLLVAIGFFGSCAKNSTAAADQKKKKTLTLAVYKDPPSLHPHEISATLKGMIFGKSLFEGLTRLDPEGNPQLAGAKNVCISECQTEYTFTLRPNRYHDGSYVSAYDYEHCWKEALKPESPCVKAYFLYCIKNGKAAKEKRASLDDVGIHALDDHTLHIKLEHPAPYLLNLLASPLFAPLKFGEAGLLFNGPYQVEEWKKTSSLKLTPNPFFWDQSRLNIHTIDAYVIEDVITALALYDQGEIDWVGWPFNLLTADVLEAGLKKGTLTKSDTPVYFPFWFRLNPKCPPLASPLIRQALSCVIDRKEITQHILIGDDPLFTPFPNAKNPPSSSPFDSKVEKGKRLFAQGLVELGLTKQTFPPIRLLSVGVGVHKKLAEYLQEKWQKTLGIQVNLEICDLATFYKRLTDGNYHIGGHFISIEHNSPLAYLELLSHTSNFSPWECSEYEKLVNELRHEKDPMLRKTLAKKAEDLIYREMPIIWIANRSSYNAHRADLENLCFDHIGVVDFSQIRLKE